MRILYLYQYFGTPNGSWSTRVYELCRRWVAKGHEVTVVTAPYEKSDIRANGFISKVEIEGIRVIIINASDSNRDPVWKRAVRALQFSVTASWYALTLKYDRVICSSGPITIGIPGILAHWLRRKRMIFEVRDLWPAGGIEMGKIKPGLVSKLALWFERLCYRNAALIVTCSPDQRNHIIGRYPQLNVIVIPQGCDLGLFGASNGQLPEWAKNKTIFTHIGSLGFIHNCGLLVQAAQHLANWNRSDVMIVFAGEGAERKRLEDIVTTENLTNVKFLGLLPKVMLPSWVQASCATLFSTLDNPVQNSSSPNKVFDSFAAGVPVIQTTTGWLAKLIDEEGCGINVKPNDPEALAQAMIQLASRTELQEKLRANSRRVAQTHFDRDVLAEKYLDAIVNL